MSEEIQFNKQINRRKIESFVEPNKAKVNEAFWPVPEDFKELWKTMTKQQKVIVQASIECKTIGEVTLTLKRKAEYVVDMVQNSFPVGRAILMAKMLRLNTDTAKAMLLQAYLVSHKTREFYFDEVVALVQSDESHLKEIAGKLVVDGDGKRGILKEIVAYGMQVKKVEDAVIDPTTQVQIAPMVVALADPRMAFNALQELNRMDHEYGQDDKATSSIESQAERIRRLSQKMNKVAEREAKRVNAIAQPVKKGALTSINSEGGV